MHRVWTLKIVVSHGLPRSFENEVHVATHVHGRLATMVYVGDDPSETGGNEDYILSATSTVDAHVGTGGGVRNMGTGDLVGHPRVMPLARWISLVCICGRVGL